MTIEQQPVVARTKKMRALWTLEASQDLKAYHNLDLERELTDILGKEIRLEVDRELIDDLRGIAYDLSTDQGMFAPDMLDQTAQTNQMNFAPVGDSTFDQFQFNGTDGTALNLPGTSPKVLTVIFGLLISNQVPLTLLLVMLVIFTPTCLELLTLRLRTFTRLLSVVLVTGFFALP